jgi:predicted RNase H-like nuclease (RuvC/YqgF family)
MTTPRRTSSRLTKTAEVPATDTAEGTAAESPTKQPKRKATPLRRSTTSASTNQQAQLEELAALKAEVASLHAAIREVADNTSLLNRKLRDTEYHIKDSQNEIMKLQVVEGKVKELVRSDDRVQSAILEDIKPVLECFNRFMDDTRARVVTLEREGEAAARKRQRTDSVTAGAPEVPAANPAANPTANPTMAAAFTFVDDQ